MSRRYKNCFRSEVLEFIQGMGEIVILRSDINSLGESRQISRALKALVNDGELIRFGYGIYVKSQKTNYSDDPIMNIPLSQAGLETLNRLGVRWELGRAIRDYNEGKTQQVPARFIVRLKDRYRGKLSNGKREIIFERGINAR